MDKLVFCRDCGFENADMTKFCRNCGSVFDASMGATPVPEEESSQILDTYSYSDQYEKKTYDKYTTVYEKKGK